MAAVAEARLDRTLSAIADRTRRAILLRLREGETRVTDIAAPFRMSLNAVSKHVRVLERAGLVRRDVRGREHWLVFDGAPLGEAEEWILSMQRFWNERLDALETFLVAHPSGRPQGKTESKISTPKRRRAHGR
ncbi:MAG TPA: metalloregulator ArsR/SmtB family transcription factor [Stellaceae bacterium]|nr:metalloregulator ArsR/SmtB family transcription factor [Stellaceae bacterium]